MTIKEARRQRAFCFSRQSCNYAASLIVPVEGVGCSISASDGLPT